MHFKKRRLFIYSLFFLCFISTGIFASKIKINLHVSNLTCGSNLDFIGGKCGNIPGQIKVKSKNKRILMGMTQNISFQLQPEGKSRRKQQNNKCMFFYKLHNGSIYDYIAIYVRIKQEADSYYLLCSTYNPKTSHIIPENVIDDPDQCSLNNYKPIDSKTKSITRNIKIIYSNADSA